MAKNEDVNKANDGAPAADIPNLKEKEKERKKAGAAWGGARGGPGSFSGATGGNVARAAASAAGAAGEAAGAAGAAGAGAAGLFGAGAGGFSLSGFLAGLAATMAGKVILGVAAMALLMGGALAAYALLKGGGAAGAGGYGDLGALASDMHVRGAGVDRTGYLASKGEIMFDPAKAAAAPAEKKEETPAEAPPSGDAVPPNQTADKGDGSNWNRPGLEHNMSGAKLSSSLGGGGFGGKNIFGGGSAANKLGDSMGRFNIQGGQKGKLSGRSATGRTGRSTAGSSRAGPKANKAFGQLKVARGASMAGAGSSTTEGAAASAARAFDGSNIGTGQTGGGPGSNTGPTGTNPGSGTTNPGGPGAPDITPPPDPTPNIDLQGQQTAAMIAAIAAMAQKAGEMKKKGMMLMAIGAVITGIGIAMLPWPWAAAIIAIGAMLIGMGLMMMQMAAKMKAMAESMGDQLAAQNTDQNQNDINRYCIGQAYEGTPPANCNPPSDVSNRDEHDRVRREGLIRQDNMIRETGRVEGDNGGPTP